MFPHNVVMEIFPGIVTLVLTSLRLLHSGPPDNPLLFPRVVTALVSVSAGFKSPPAQFSEAVAGL